MIDLHMHILPGVDDGPQTLNDSIAMLAEAKRLGFDTLISTVHLLETPTDAWIFNVETIYNEVRAHAHEHGLELLLGYEHMISPDLPRRLGSGEPTTLGGSKSVLVEVPIANWLHYLEQTFFELRTHGFRPILAHPERYPMLERNNDLMKRLVDQDITMQVTTSAFSGAFGKHVQRTVSRWLDSGFVHLIGTDAHSIGRRLSETPDGLHRIRRRVGDEELLRLTQRAPAAMLENTPLPLPAAHDSEQTDGLFSRLTGLFRS